MKPFRNPRTLALVGALLGLALTAHAESLVCDGVLGNSGEQGDTLVRFAPAEARGLGAVLDRNGGLWDRAGRGRLNRYALDGRLLASYPISDHAEGHDQLSLVGDTLVILVDRQLFALPITAAAGTAPTALLQDVRVISFGSANGLLAIARNGADRDHSVVDLLDPRSAALTPVTTLNGGCEALELAPDGIVYAVVEWQVHRFVTGVETTTGWPRAWPGERPQLIDGRWYGNAWHSTIKRFDSAMEPAPGVVFGGASGSFIGHLDQNSELVNGRGMARVRDDLFAASGISGVLQLLEWHGDRQQFAAVRRIAGVQSCTALGLDRAGNIYHVNGVWDWNGLPDAPLRSGVNGPSSLGQAVMLDDDQMIAPGFLWDRASFYRGKLTGEVAIQRIDAACALSRKTLGSAIYPSADGKERILLTIDADGATQSFRLSAGDGAYQSDLGPVTLKTATPVAAWTTLAMRGRDTLLAAGDGAVIEFTRDGSNWTEKRRWSSWGDRPEQHFGGSITIAGDAKTLAVSDTGRHRVLCFDLASGAPRCAFGTLDAAGTALGTLDSPTTIAVRDRRVVVFDRGNQRLMKLLLAE